MPFCICNTCGEPIKRKPSHIKQYNYCDQECRGKGLSRRRQEEIEQQFGEPIFTLLYDLYCLQCLGIKQVAKRIGISDRVLWDWLNDLGIQRRERSHAVALQWQGNDKRRKQAASAIQQQIATSNINNFGDNNPAKLSESRQKISKAKSEHNWMSGRGGPLHHMWKGGKIYYYGPSWNRQRKYARERDNYTCQHCGVTETELSKELDVHHKIKFRIFGIEHHEEANDLSNLICLCNPCHIIAETKAQVKDGICILDGQEAAIHQNHH